MCFCILYMYNVVMQLLRRGGSGFLLLLFQLLLLVFPIVLALRLILGSPAIIQGTIKESGVYDQLVPALLNQSATEAAQNGDAETAQLLAQQGIRDAAQKSFSPQALESTTNQAIDGFYAWLQGKTNTPEVTIDLSPYRQNLIENLHAYALEQTNKLPTCTLQQLRELQEQSPENVLNAKCLPAGISAQDAADQFSEQLINENGFLRNPTIRSQDLKDANGAPIFDAADWLPTVYRWLMIAPWAIGGLILLTALGSILLHEERWRGVRRVGIALVVTGLLLLAGSTAYWLLVGNIDRFITGPTGDLQATVSKIMASSFGSYVRTVAMTGGAYAVLGAIGLIIARRQGRGASKVPAASSPTPPATTSTNTPTTISPAESIQPHPVVPEDKK